MVKQILLALLLIILPGCYAEGERLIFGKDEFAAVREASRECRSRGNSALITHRGDHILFICKEAKK